MLTTQYLKLKTYAKITCLEIFLLTCIYITQLDDL